MSKAEKFISEHTMTCSNVIDCSGMIYGGELRYHNWLTPDQALRVVEIAREEVIEKACDAYCKVCGHYPHTTPAHICRQACDYYKDFIQSIV